MRTTIRLKPVPVVVLAVLMFAPSSAPAAVPSAAHLTIHAQVVPTRFSSTDTATCLSGVGSEFPSCDQYRVTVVNTGSRPTSKPVRLTDLLPAGVHVIPSGTQVQFFWGQNVEKELFVGEKLSVEELCKPEAVPVSCEFSEPLKPDDKLEMFIFVTTEPGALSAVNTASAAEVGEPPASTSEPDVIGSTLPPFGPSAFTSDITGADGEPANQAGAHPYELVNKIDLNSKLALSDTSQVEGVSVAGVKDVVVDLPLGFLGSATSTPQCTFAQLQSFPQSCPLDTLVGHLGTEPGATASANSPVYNMLPERGVAAEFGFRDLLYGTHVIVASVAPTPTGYVLRATAREVPEIPLTNVVTTFYGNPSSRNGGGATPAAMFTNPSDCSSEPLITTLHIDSWVNPGAFNTDGVPNLKAPGWVAMTTESPPVTGCDLLRFQPEAFTFAPETAHSQADEPSGYESVLKIPQSQTPETLATPPLKTAVVTLPPGVAISPSAADGLVGCQETGAEGIEFESASGGHCPAASKVGSVEVITPLLTEHFTGSVFVAQPACGGPGQPECAEVLAEEGKLFAIYLEIGSENTGVHIKLRGKVEVGGDGEYSRTHGLQPGQVRTSFIETPQFPFSELMLKFNSGPRAPLANPQWCGTFTTNANLEPWSAPESGPNAIMQPSFTISGGCSNGFAPTFSAGTVNNQAGAYAPFTTTFSRHGGEQNLSGVTVNMPQGLLGKIAGITQCPEAQANAGTCPSASKIGTATAAAGSGSHPFWQSGTVYLTGTYNGGPFGLSVVVPAVAGPYNLGLIVVRASIRINPITAAATIVSDPLPQSVDGVPLRVQTVNVTVGQENNFTFNATNCIPSSINATLTSTRDAQVSVSSPYQPANCATLPFKPQFTVSTAGKTSKANGASLNVKIAYPTGGQANIAKVDLQFPKILPARLTTLQKACTEAQFNTNPAGCPAASDIATVTVHTPLLNAPLAGPAYFVSHGGAAFPDVEMILQGEGVTLVVDGKTQIKNGITYSRFETNPDAPFSTFEFNAPQGPYSILTANANLCAPTTTKTIKKRVTLHRHGHTKHVLRSVTSTIPEPLIMPTTITGQNGAVINQNTKINVTGCPKTKKAVNKKANHHGGKKGKGKK